MKFISWNVNGLRACVKVKTDDDGNIKSKGFEEYFNELDGLLTGELSIGGANISMNYILPDIITAFSAAYPGIRITLREDSTISLKRLLADEALDFVIDSNNFTDGDFDVNTLFTNRILLAVPSQYALSPSEMNPLTDATASSGSAPQPTALTATALTAEDIANGRHWDPNITPLPIEAIGDALLHLGLR